MKKTTLPGLHGRNGVPGPRPRRPPAPGSPLRRRPGAVRPAPAPSRTTARPPRPGSRTAPGEGPARCSRTAPPRLEAAERRRHRRPRGHRRRVRRVPDREGPTRSSRSSRSSAPGSAARSSPPRPSAQRDPRAGPHEGQLDHLGARLRQGLLRRPVQRRRRVDRELTTGPVRRPLQRRRQHERLGQGARQRLDVRRQRGRGRRRLVGVHRRHRRRVVPVQVAASKTPARSTRYLAQFDEWDRYDFDGDGEFNEPDGYIDHFQAVHAGEGEEAGADPDAIWSHRWYVNGDRLRRHRPDGRGARPTSAAARRSATRTTSSATTPSSRRTAAWACSPTSSATTSASPTSTTPTAARTARAFWTLMSRAPGSATAAPRRASAPRPAYGPGGEALPRLARLHRGEPGADQRLTLGPSQQHPRRRRTRPSR